MGGGISVCNDLDIPAHVGLSLLTPVYHEFDVRPNQCATWRNIGIVYFTINVLAANEHNKKYINDEAAITEGLTVGFAMALAPVAVVAPIAGAGAIAAGAGTVAGGTAIQLAKMSHDTRQELLNHDGLLARMLGAYANWNSYYVRYKQGNDPRKEFEIVYGHKLD